MVTSGDVKKAAPEACPEFETRIGVSTGGGWNQEDGHWIDAEYVYKVQPLVVIDPEDDRHVAAVENALEACGILAGTYVQAALRSLVADPKPDEPTGRFAIALADGVMYCRAAWRNDKPWSRIGTDHFAAWDEMDVESVEFEGLPS